MSEETPEQRAERILKEDEEKRKEKRKQQEKELLIDNQLKRKETVEKYKAFIDGMVIGKQKQITYRRHLKNKLEKGADTLFETEDDEYDYIGKFGRGMWNEDFIRKGFVKADQEIIKEIAHGHGAFDY